ncbi:hypothetical protein HMPREF3185_00102 [Porphyromonas somerae]|uniref:Uncharacterized protein n=1 Tax=Porphyromonas somerae TaxID=322095 RepID=A0A134B4M2_9PORP|nr:hypothetical protein HMPREF3184_01575 [Porphyromonadaceae bacterium KA00676]KXB74899.1 hypothetical protein HMPREF3185_01575 [Porphyromonas somerae]KXB77256.1 hypothetical protein HMPREF3184_00102 [Porphyromonadaceae bacterium KA00676]KXB78576.1 hypothetical protein HMPREF3185_00102 [Porphyromonas somerae]
MHRAPDCVARICVNTYKREALLIVRFSVPLSTEKERCFTFNSHSEE